MIARLLARFVKSYCAACNRPFYSNVRQPCRCGATARAFARSVSDQIVPDDHL